MIKSVTQHSYFVKKPNNQMGRLQNNPSIGWVHPKSRHACLLVWDNKKPKKNNQKALESFALDKGDE